MIPVGYLTLNENIASLINKFPWIHSSIVSLKTSHEDKILF